MSATGLSVAIRNPLALSRAFDLRAIPPTLVKRDPAPRRTKIWEFNANLHCSIIGTCLSGAELRQALKKFGMASQDCTDHELHGVAVSLAGRHDDAARQLHKALDHRHKLAINQFAKAATEAALRGLWRDAVRRGDIPGAYWATLTHPLTTQTIIREAFGEVHMLSHLVGSANRADIRRLCVLEADKAALEVKIQRQQQALHAAIVTRDRQISELRQALTQQIASGLSETTPDENMGLPDLVHDLERRLAAEFRRRTAVEERLASMQKALTREQSARVSAERKHAAISDELAGIEGRLNLDACPGPDPEFRLQGLVLLYVGGRPNQVAAMRTAVERLGASLLHHDGGIEHHPTMLPGMASRSDVILFPVDCISHDAANAVKTLCRQTAKRFIPLRSASITSLLMALQTPELTALAEAAD